MSAASEHGMLGGSETPEELDWKQAVEAAFGKSITTDWWEALNGLLGDASGDLSAADWAGLLREYMDVGLAPASDSGAKRRLPRHDRRWRETRQFLDSRADDQKRALATMGLNDFIAPESVLPLLEGIALMDAGGESRRGPNTATLWCYPHYDDLPRYSDPDYTFEPFSHPERMRPVHFATGIRPEDFDTAPGGARIEPAYAALKAWESTRLSRLARLKRLSTALVDETDCLEADALAFLLSNREFLLPRVRVIREMRPLSTKLGSVLLPGTDRPQLTIRVSSSRVPVSEVAAVYKEARERIEGDVPSLTVQERDAMLVEFRSQRRDLSWAECWSEWNALADRQHFSSAARMKAIHHKAAK